MGYSLKYGGASLGLHNGETTIGRSTDSDIVLNGPHVSRRHTAIHVGSDLVTARDLGSRNGTTVNGVPIVGTTTILPGDIVGVGSEMLELALATSARGFPTAPPGPSDPTRGTCEDEEARDTHVGLTNLDVLELIVIGPTATERPSGAAHMVRSAVDAMLGRLRNNQLDDIDASRLYAIVNTISEWSESSEFKAWASGVRDRIKKVTSTPSPRSD